MFCSIKDFVFVELGILCFEGCLFRMRRGAVKAANVTNFCNGQLAAPRVSARDGRTEAQETARGYACG